MKVFGFKKINPVINEWEIEEELTEKLSEEVLEKIYNEGEIRFNSIVDDITLVRSRSYTLITIFISLLSILITICFSSDLSYFNSLDKKALFLLFFIDIIIIAYLILQLVLILAPNNMMLKGEEPMIMNYSGMSQLSKEHQKKVYLLNSIIAVQEKIEYNEFIIQKKNERLESVIFIATLVFIITLTLIFILN